MGNFQIIFSTPRIIAIEEGRRKKEEERRKKKRMGIQTPTNCKHHVDRGVLNPKSKDNE
ncbi:MAG: hypothetical protein F6K17_08060 [Okeania sp. SIO3C4]|nr:hypothetical protein [Okeania sp. SIO3C4]